MSDPGAAGPGGAPELLPDLDAIPPDVLHKARLLILSYPTNPTAFCAPVALFEKALEFARRHRLVLVHDFAYAEIYFDGYRPSSLLALHGAKEIAVEFHSFSKTFSMAGWRVDFAIGNPEILAMIMKFKSNCDYGVFQATQIAATAALQIGDAELDAAAQGGRRLLARCLDHGFVGVEREHGSRGVGEAPGQPPVTAAHLHDVLAGEIDQLVDRLGLDALGVDQALQEALPVWPD